MKVPDPKISATVDRML